MAMPTFETLDADQIIYGRADQVSGSIRRVVAENPSKFTYLGTGTYLIDGGSSTVVVDPGPILDSHRDALAAAVADRRVAAILITHCHSDHSPLAAWLAAETGAPTIAFGPHPRPDDDVAELFSDLAVLDELGVDDAAGGTAGDTDTDDRGSASDVKDSRDVEVEESVDHDFVPDVVAADGEVVWDDDGITITAVHTPGHTSNHMCYAFAQEQALFTGDHVMGWSTTVVAPPDGDMISYMESLYRVAGRNDAVLWPTHGPPRHDGSDYVRALYEHRVARETQIIEALRAGPQSIVQMVPVLYAAVPAALHKAAAMSVYSHLTKSVAEGAVAVVDGGPPRLSSTYAAV
jgi:glyoxylase-like metal-dependent hydrolase (beta-lactamase superfamily II)